MTALDDRPGLGLDDDAGTVAALVEELGNHAARRVEVEQQRDQLRRVVLEQSDALDRSREARLAMWPDGYRAGFTAGDETGSARTAREWHVTLSNTGTYDIGQHGPTWAELDRRRYPPHGRLGWLLDRVGATYRDWSAYCAAEDGGQL